MADHVVRMEEGRSALKILIGYLQERDLYEGLGLDERKILEWNFRKKYQYEELS